ncbi:MAG TPA: sialidase family protein, partial [Actinomycetota bacterium]
PKPGPNGFHWANGVRLYYANLTSSLTGSTKKTESGFKGFEAIAVSRTDNVAAAAANNSNAWKAPVIATRQASTTFSDHEQITVDDAEQTSPYFGNTYVCFAMFRSAASSPEPIAVARSTDGGDTWTTRQISQATNNTQTVGRQDCNIRTDSRGVVYVVWEGGYNKRLAVLLARSFDGGKTFERPRPIGFFDEVGIFDPNNETLSFDGLAGTRTSAIPWIDIANGSPTGTNATDEIVVSWNDGPTPSDTNPAPNERVEIAYSANRGQTFTTATANAAESGDRPDFPAVGISPNGGAVFLVYMAFHEPWQSTTADPRLMEGVVRRANSPGMSAPAAWTTVHRGATGDARGSSTNSLASGFLGDYNNVDVGQGLAYAVWNDVRNAADCPVIDAYRQSLSTDDPLPRPAPNDDCPATFGNSDIYGAGFPV